MVRQPDGLFEDELLSSLYDYFNAWDARDDFYLALARDSGGHVLDLGCGTGMLACRIAQEGLSVTAVDPAAGMLHVARARAGAERVAWIKAHGQNLRLSTRFDLIYMTGHAFQTLLSDDEAVALLRRVRDHLAAHGCFAFESRNPARQAWLAWTPERRELALTKEHGRVEESCEATADPQTGIVDLVHHYRFLDAGRVVRGESRLRFVDQEHLERMLSEAGLTPTVWFGDWDRSPVTPESRELIALAICAD